MNQIALAAVLAVIEEFLPRIVTSEALTKVTKALVALAPLVIQEAKDLWPIWKRIAAVVKGDNRTLTEQLDELDAVEAKYDADFDAAAAAARANPG